MICVSRFATCSLLLCLLFSLVSASARCQTGENYVISGSELTQLSTIFERLDALNARLQSELTASRESLTQLENELIGLKQDLDELQKHLAASGTELTQLREQLRIAQDLLTRVERSFEEYRNAAESRIRRLMVQRNVCVALAVLALIF
jgi:septal ring factor EnvC (AmiA/AmiB activator)